MPFFRYLAADSQGVQLRGRVDKETAAQVFDHLEAQRLHVIEIKRLHFWERDLTEFSFFKPRANKKDLAVLCREMAFVLDAGLVMSRAVAVCTQEAPNKRMKEHLHAARDGVMRGESLHDALAGAGYFPGFFLRMVEVGEKSGRLGHVMGQLAKYYRRESQTADEIGSAMIYPAIVGVLMFGVLAFFITGVVPGYSAMFAGAGAELPFFTRMVVRLSEWAAAGGFAVVFIICIVLVILFSGFRRRLNHAWTGWVKLYFPFTKKLYRQIIAQRFSQILGVLLDAGVDIIQTLELVQTVVNNRVIEREMDRIVDGVRQGQPLSGLLDEKYFEPVLRSMALTGEETGNLPDAMAACAAFLEEQTGTQLRRLNKLVEPLITIVLGIVLGIVMMAVVLPTFYLIELL